MAENHCQTSARELCPNTIADQDLVPARKPELDETKKSAISIDITSLFTKLETWMMDAIAQSASWRNCQICMYIDLSAAFLRMNCNVEIRPADLAWNRHTKPLSV